jgi:serine/threonine protein kinase
MLEIGEGGFAFIYLGIWNTQECAIKIFKGFGFEGTSTSDDNKLINNNVLNFEKEFQFVSELRHKNIISFLGFIYNPMGLILEYCFYFLIFYFFSKI